MGQEGGGDQNKMTSPLQSVDSGLAKMALVAKLYEK
jgi:hypothetical protein